MNSSRRMIIHSNSVQPIESVGIVDKLTRAINTGWGRILVGLISIVLLGGVIAIITISIVLALANEDNQSTVTASTISTIKTRTTATTTSTSTTTTTTKGPQSIICSTTTSSANLYKNQFIYSPTSQSYAAGMLKNQFGIYVAYGYQNVSSQSIWTAPQYSTPVGDYFAAQSDRNLVMYGPAGYPLWASNTYIGGLSDVFCLQMLDNGNLIWTDAANSIIWQSNSAVPG